MSNYLAQTAMHECLFSPEQQTLILHMDHLQNNLGVVMFIYGHKRFSEKKCNFMHIKKPSQNSNYFADGLYIQTNKL